MPVSLVVHGRPAEFSLGAASGSSTSQTVSAGQTASFNLALAPAGRVYRNGELQLRHHAGRNPGADLQRAVFRCRSPAAGRRPWQ